MSPSLPPIVMTWREHARLSYLAGVVWPTFPEFSDYLMRELDRATLVAPERLGPATVRMGSRVEFTDLDSGAHHILTVVFPADEDISSGMVSILSPVGAALIGLSEGQSIEYRTLRGETRTITLLKVHQPVDDR